MTSFALVPSARAEVYERLRLANDRAKSWHARQVIAHFVTAGQPRRRCEVQAVAQKIGETRVYCIGYVEHPAGEEFIEKPGAPVGCSGWGRFRKGKKSYAEAESMLEGESLSEWGCSVLLNSLHGAPVFIQLLFSQTC